MVERLQVQSRSPFEIHHILTGLEKTPEIDVASELFLPEGEGPFGCVVALHGSMGWASHHQDHINGWLDAGLAVCKVNSFASRSIDSTVDDQLTVTHSMMLVDAFRTRSLLEQDPRIGKIGITGWSLGGTVALYSAWAPIIEKLGTPFDAHLPFYPAAHLRPGHPGRHPRVGAAQALRVGVRAVGTGAIPGRGAAGGDGHVQGGGAAAPRRGDPPPARAPPTRAIPPGSARAGP